MRFLTLINNYILTELRYKTFIKNHKNGWKFERGKETVIPVKILNKEDAKNKEIPSLQKYDIHVKDNHNYFIGSALVSNSIPEGMYGAGKVEIWDSGTYEMVESKKDKLVFRLEGRKLKGEYCLVKFLTKEKKPAWLFFRTKP